MRPSCSLSSRSRSCCRCRFLRSSRRSPSILGHPLSHPRFVFMIPMTPHDYDSMIVMTHLYITTHAAAPSSSPPHPHSPAFHHASHHWHSSIRSCFRWPLRRGRCAVPILAYPRPPRCVYTYSYYSSSSSPTYVHGPCPSRSLCSPPVPPCSEAYASRYTPQPHAQVRLAPGVKYRVSAT